MLFDIDGKQLTKIPYPETYQKLTALTSLEIRLIKDALNKKIAGDEIHTAGWMPGADWTDTPFQPIYEKAAHRDFNLAAKLFGLTVYEVFMEHEEKWYTLKADKDGKPIGSRTYFKST